MNDKLLKSHGAPDAKVNCGKCTACCKRNLIALTDVDNPEMYVTKELYVPSQNQTCLVLEHQDNGDCFYLGPEGCTIYEHRPHMCRTFSCVGFVRNIMAQTTRNERRRLMKTPAIGKDVWREGLKRLNAGES